MTDYVPNTGEIKRSYVRQLLSRWPDYDGDLGQEFDRWLAEHDRQVETEAWDDCINQVCATMKYADGYISFDGRKPYRETEQ